MHLQPRRHSNSMVRFLTLYTYTHCSRDLKCYCESKLHISEALQRIQFAVRLSSIQSGLKMYNMQGNLSNSFCLDNKNINKFQVKSKGSIFFTKFVKKTKKNPDLLHKYNCKIQNISQKQISQMERSVSPPPHIAAAHPNLN